MDPPPCNKEINIYNKVRVKENVYELPLFTNIRLNNVERVNTLLDIYKTDLDYIKESLNFDSKLLVSNPVFIGYGEREITELEKLYSEYRLIEIVELYDIQKCVVILLKCDNLKIVKALCLSPNSERGKMLTLKMWKIVYNNNSLNINAKDDNNLSLLNATAVMGMFNESLRLMDLGTYINVLDLATNAIAGGQIEYLDKMYKIFKFPMYDIFASDTYFKSIFGQDNWPLFEYIVIAVMAEKHLSWRQIVNYDRLVDKQLKNKHHTVFHYAIRGRHYRIVDKILLYTDCIMKSRQCICQPIRELYFCADSSKLLLKMLEIQPSQLEIVRTLKNNRGFGVFHQLLVISNLDFVITIYQKYPFVKDLFFKNAVIGKAYIRTMLSAEQCGVFKYVLENSSVIPHSLLYEILLELTYYRKDDNVKLFQYVIWMMKFNFALLTTFERNKLFQKALQNRNDRIFQILLLAIECDLNDINFLRQINLLHLVFSNKFTSNETFILLLQRRVSFNKICCEGKNMLHYSVAANNLYTTKTLLELHLDMNMYDKKGKLPIHYATTAEIFELLNTWTSKSYVNARTRFSGCTPLHLCMLAPKGAATNKLMRYILDNDGNIDAQNFEMNAPILLVSDVERAKILLERKPNLKVDHKMEYILIPRFLANFQTHDVIRLIFENRSLINLIKNKIIFHQILMFAIINKSPLTKWLLDGYSPCVEVSVCDEEKNSLIHIAAEAKHFAIIQQLIDKGVSIEQRNNKNETVLLFICNRLGNEGQLQNFLCVLNSNPDVNVRNGSNESSIILVSRQEYEIKVRFIIELLLRGANLLDSHCPGGTTAFDNLTSGHKQLFNFLF